MKKIIGIISIILGVTSYSYTQDKYQLETSISQQKIGYKDSLVYQIQVTGSRSVDTSHIELPRLSSDWNVLSNHHSSSVSIINGIQKITKIISITMIPKHSGKILIGAAKLKYKANITSESHIVEVTDQAYEEVAQQPVSIRVKAQCSKKSCYVGEIIEYWFTLNYDDSLVGQPQYEPPSFEGFLQLEGKTLEPRRKENRRFISQVITPLVPLHSGIKKIEATTLKCSVSEDGSGSSSLLGLFSGDPFSMFSSGRDVILHTEELECDIKPLPKPQPKNFSGVVGSQVQFLVEVPQKKYAVGETITLKVQIKIRGLLKESNRGEWVSSEDFEVYPSPSAKVVHSINESLMTYEVTLIPYQAGNQKLPRLRLVYFDTEIQSYQTKLSDEIEVEITPSTKKNGLLKSKEKQKSEEFFSQQEDIKVHEKSQPKKELRVAFLKEGKTIPLWRPNKKALKWLEVILLFPLIIVIIVGYVVRISLKWLQEKQKSAKNILKKQLENIHGGESFIKNGPEELRRVCCKIEQYRIQKPINHIKEALEGLRQEEGFPYKEVEGFMEQSNQLLYCELKEGDTQQSKELYQIFTDVKAKLILFIEQSNFIK